jgi:hypothetical protein
MTTDDSIHYRFYREMCMMLGDAWHWYGMWYLAILLFVVGVLGGVLVTLVMGPVCSVEVFP